VFNHDAPGNTPRHIVKHASSHCHVSESQPTRKRIGEENCEPASPFAPMVLAPRRRILFNLGRYYTTDLCPIPRNLGSTLTQSSKYNVNGTFRCHTLHGRISTRYSAGLWVFNAALLSQVIAEPLTVTFGGWRWAIAYTAKARRKHMIGRLSAKACAYVCVSLGMCGLSKHRPKTSECYGKDVVAAEPEGMVWEYTAAKVSHLFLDLMKIQNFRSSKPPPSPSFP